MIFFTRFSEEIKIPKSKINFFKFQKGLELLKNKIPEPMQLVISDYSERQIKLGILWELMIPILVSIPVLSEILQN